MKHRFVKKREITLRRNISNNALKPNVSTAVLAIAIKLFIRSGQALNVEYCDIITIVVKSNEWMWYINVFCATKSVLTCAVAQSETVAKTLLKKKSCKHWQSGTTTYVWVWLYLHIIEWRNQIVRNLAVNRLKNVLATFFRLTKIIIYILKWLIL